MNDKPDLVLASDAKDRIDIAISLPEILMSSDGRLFEVLSWEPLVAQGSVVSVKIEAIIRMEAK